MAGETEKGLRGDGLTHVWVVRVLAVDTIGAVLSSLARLASPRIASAIVLNVVSNLTGGRISSNCVADLARGAGLAGSVIVVVRSRTCSHGRAIR